MFCKKCGKKLTEDVVFCPDCGTPTGEGATPPTPQAQPVPPMQPMPPQGMPAYPGYGYYQKPKLPGNGLAVAGMVLGIIAIAYAFITILALTTDDFKRDVILYRSEIGYYAFGVILVQSVLALVGLPLSITGRVKTKNGKALAGIILNSVTIIISIILFIYVIMNYG